jgi:hypothetical protein
MEKQVDYRSSVKAKHSGVEIDPERLAHVAMYSYWRGKALAAYEGMWKDIRAGDIRKHVDYRKYQELVEKIDKFGKEIAVDIDSYKGVCLLNNFIFH